MKKSPLTLLPFTNFHLFPEWKNKAIRHKQLDFLSRFLFGQTKLTQTLLPGMPYPASTSAFSKEKHLRQPSYCWYLSFYLDLRTHTLVSVHEQVNTPSVGHVSLISPSHGTWWQVARAQVNENNRKKAKPKVRARGATRPPWRTACHGDCLNIFRGKENIYLYRRVLRPQSIIEQSTISYEIGNYRTVSSEIFRGYNIHIFIIRH